MLFEDSEIHHDMKCALYTNFNFQWDQTNHGNVEYLMHFIYMSKTTAEYHASKF